MTLKLRFADFRTLTRSWTGDPTQDGLELYRRATALLQRIPLSQAVRLIGISASRLGAWGTGAAVPARPGERSGASAWRAWWTG